MGALKAAHIGRGSYLCQSCAQVFGPKEVQVDHIVPVTPPEFSGIEWTEYVERLFCGIDGLRVLCKGCHHTVTGEQRKAKIGNRRKRKA